MRIYNEASESFYRLKNVLISDKQFNPEQVKKILKADLIKVLKNYADFDTDNLLINFSIDDNGNYQIQISITAQRLKIFGHLDN